MSFNLVLTSTAVSATNTSLKDFTWLYNFSQVADGDYEVSFVFNSGNATGVVSQTSLLPIQLTMDIGAFPSSYIGGSVSKSSNTSILGSIKVNWFSALLATFSATTNDNSPVYFKALNKSSNSIRMSLQSISGALVATGVSNWVVILNFKKL